MKTRTNLIILLVIALLLSACDTGKVKSTNTSEFHVSISTAQTETSGQTSASTKAPTPPPMPTPMTEPIFIPGEELPDGQIFDERYYAVLLGAEGVVVYDCFGKIVYTEEHSNSDCETYYGSDPNKLPIGVIEKEIIEPIINHSDNISTTGFSRYDFPGGHVEYSVWSEENSNQPPKYYLRVFSNNGEELQVEWDAEKTYMFGVVPFEESTGICVEVLCSAGSEEGYNQKIFFVRINADGSVALNIVIDDLAPGPIQIVGEKYAVVSEYDKEGNRKWFLADLFGNILMEDVNPIPIKLAVSLPEGMGSVFFYDYFMKDGRVYDARLKPVPDETKSPDGHLIPGVKYYVDGIECEVLDGFEESDSINFGISYAEGRDESGALAIKSDWGEVVIRDVGDDVYVAGVNSSLLVLSNYTIYSSTTGEFIANTRFGNANGPQFQIADEYLLLQYDFGFSIIDNDGNLRYVSDSGNPMTLSGEYFLLWKDSGCALMDLNGEVVLEP